MLPDGKRISVSNLPGQTSRLTTSQYVGDAKNTAKKFTDQGQGKVDELKQKGQEAAQSVKDAASNVTGSVPGGSSPNRIRPWFFRLFLHCCCSRMC